MSLKSSTSARKHHFEEIKYYLQKKSYPQGLSATAKRNVRFRAKSFVVIEDVLYHISEKSRRGIGGQKDGDDDDDDIDNPENGPDHTQILKKVLLTEEERQVAIDQLHIDEKGIHIGMCQTLNRVSSQYYWVGIANAVYEAIRNCPVCMHRCLENRKRVKTICSSSALSVDTAVTAPAEAEQVTYIMDQESNIIDTGELDFDIEDISEAEINSDTILTSDSHCTSSIFHRELTAPSMPRDPVKVEKVQKEIGSYFWQKVEVQIFGPYQASEQQMYVAIALDSYSQFPEAGIIKDLSTDPITNFLLNMFCRNGMIEKLMLLQNKVTKKREFVNTDDLLQSGITGCCVFREANPLDERWMHIEKVLEHFVSMYPKAWGQCLEACLMTLRFTLPPEADYSPFFLSHNREPTLPGRLTGHWNITDLLSHDVRLSEDQEKQTVDIITAAYKIDTAGPTCSCNSRCRQHYKPVITTPVILSDHEYATQQPEIQIATRIERNPSVKRLKESPAASMQETLTLNKPETDIDCKEDTLSDLSFLTKLSPLVASVRKVIKQPSVVSTSPKSKLKDSDFKTELVFLPVATENKNAALPPGVVVVDNEKNCDDVSILQEKNGDQMRLKSQTPAETSMFRKDSVAVPLDVPAPNFPLPSIGHEIHSAGDENDALVHEQGLGKTNDVLAGKKCLTSVHHERKQKASPTAPKVGNQEFPQLTLISPMSVTASPAVHRVGNQQLPLILPKSVTSKPVRIVLKQAKVINNSVSTSDLSTVCYVVLPEFGANQPKPDTTAVKPSGMSLMTWDKKQAIIQKLAFDTFCFIVSQFIQWGTFPEGISLSAKQLVEQFSCTAQVKDGRLFCSSDKSTLRRFITGEKARFGILRKAHVLGEEHYSRARALRFLADNKLFWKGMSLDVDAFIHACPECMLHNPLRNKTVIKIPCHEPALGIEFETDDPHLSELCIHNQRMKKRNPSLTMSSSF